MFHAKADLGASRLLLCTVLLVAMGGALCASVTPCESFMSDINLQLSVLGRRKRGLSGTLRTKPGLVTLIRQ